MVTKDKQRGRRFRNKFGMTGMKPRMTMLKFGMTGMKLEMTSLKFEMSILKLRMILLILMFFSSCSFYTDLRDNPVYKTGAVSYPQNISAIYGDQSTGCITLIWELVENASAYEIYCIKNSRTNGFSSDYLNTNASMIYKYSIPYSQGKKAVLEISNISSGQNFFFIKSVSEKSSKSDYSKKYAYFYSYYSSNKSLAFREINDYEYDFNNAEGMGEKVVAGKPFTINYRGQWSNAEFDLADDWSSIVVQFAAGTDLTAIQFVLVSDAFERQESWGPRYYSEYIPITSSIMTIDFDEWLNKSLKSKGATKIVSANIQNCINDEFSVKVIEAIVTKKDGSKIAAVPEHDWGSEIELN